VFEEAKREISEEFREDPHHRCREIQASSAPTAVSLMR